MHAVYPRLMTILTALFSALIAAGTFIKIPMFPVPMTLQTLFVFLAGLLLPPSRALSSVLLFMALGLIGLPVFTSGGGIGALLSPTGGFIFGFAAAAFTGAFLSGRKNKSFFGNLLVCLVMEVIIYLFGLPWLKISLSPVSWTKVLAVGLGPFIIGDAVKILAASSSALLLKGEIMKLEEKLREREKESGAEDC